MVASPGLGFLPRGGPGVGSPNVRQDSQYFQPTAGWTYIHRRVTKKYDMLSLGVLWQIDWGMAGEALAGE